MGTTVQCYCSCYISNKKRVYLIQDNIIGGQSSELGRLKQLDVEPVQEQILKVGGLIAYRAQPLGLLLVHTEVGVHVETLEVVAGCGAGRVGHPGHPQWTGHRYLDTNRIKR